MVNSRTRRILESVPALWFAWLKATPRQRYELTVRLVQAMAQWADEVDLYYQGKP
jgi:hypothetical protein